LLSKNLKIEIYRNLILPDVYGCDTWSLTLREKRKLWVSENRALRSIFGPKREKVTVECRKLHNEEFYDQYPSSNIVRVIKAKTIGWAKHVERMGLRCGVYRGLVGKPEGREHLEHQDVDGRTILKWTSGSGM
jgi:hypothetical protein